jgi:hypothetical protein
METRSVWNGFEVRGLVTLLFLQSVEIVWVLCARDGDRAPSIPIAVVIPARKPRGCTVASKPSPVQAADMPMVRKGWRADVAVDVSCDRR